MKLLKPEYFLLPIDLGLAVALRREMLSATESKLQSIVVTSGHQWPFIEKEDSDSAEAGMEGLPINRYWKSIRERYRTESAAPCLAEAALSALLPPHWTTISLHLTSERDCFILVRHRKDEQPMIFKLPLGRQARREADDEEFLTYDDALLRLREIIEANDRTCSEGKKVTSPASRNNWWKERVALDVALGNLLLELENTWLGAFTVSYLFPLPHSSTADRPCCFRAFSWSKGSIRFPRNSQASRLGSRICFE